MRLTNRRYFALRNKSAKCAINKMCLAAVNRKQNQTKPVLSFVSGCGSGAFSCSQKTFVPPSYMLETSGERCRLRNESTGWQKPTGLAKEQTSRSILHIELFITILFQWLLNVTWWHFVNKESIVNPQIEGVEKSAQTPMKTKMSKR